MTLLGRFKTFVLKANSNPQTTNEAASPQCCETMFRNSMHQSQQQPMQFIQRYTKAYKEQGNNGLA